MNFLTRLNIGARLGAAFALLLLLLMGLGGLSVISLGKVNGATEDIATNWLVATRELGDVSSSLNRMRRIEANAVMYSDPSEQQREYTRWQQAKADADRHWSAYEATVTTDAERKLLAETKEALVAMAAAQTQLFSMKRGSPESDIAAREHFATKTRTATEDAIDNLVKLLDYQGKGADAAFLASQQEYSSTRSIVIAMVLVALALGTFLAWAITRSISRPIERAVEVAETVANGDLTSRIEVNSNDETGKLLAALKRMNEKLAGIVGQVRNSADSIATGSTQIATGNADLSQRTEEQASNLQQTAASMEQLTATVKQNAETAQQATQLASSASGAAAQGGQVVQKVVSTMGSITESSRRIADIIGVIDGIAFQTNILALNASVEAARAGEQGRGFAVVAGEVRNLAQRSAQAAKEIKSLIGESVTSVEAGSKLVEDAGKAMENIVTQVQRVSDLMGEINVASAEQSSGIGQIGDAVAQLDQVTQQNAALVEESAAAAESLRHQAAQLAHVVAQFKVDTHAGADTRRGPESGRELEAVTSAPLRQARPAAPGRPVARASYPKPQTTAEATESWETF